MYIPQYLGQIIKSQIPETFFVSTEAIPETFLSPNDSCCLHTRLNTKYLRNRFQGYDTNLKLLISKPNKIKY